MASKYYFLFDKQGKQTTYATDTKGLEDLGAWVEFNGDFDPAKDLARLVDGAVVIDNNANSLLQELNGQKRVRIKELIADFDASRKITIKNGKTLVIAHDTAEREFFLKMVENSINSAHLKDNFLEVLEYRQFTDKEVLGVRAVAYLWRYVFAEYNKQRVANKFMFETLKVAINNADTQEILDSITYKFTDALVLDINDKVAEIEADKNTPSGVLKAINDAKDGKGVVHLVKDLTA